MEKFLEYLPYAGYVVGGLFILWVALKFFVNVSADELATVERRFIGKQMADGRTVALNGEVGVQANILGPGLHFLIPFIQVAKKYPYTVIKENEVGLVEAIAGASIPEGEYVAKNVECNYFQDGTAFLTNGGQKGLQVKTLPPGEHRLNPYLFNVKIVPAVSIDEKEVGLVESLVGKATDPGKIFAQVVESQNFQDGNLFLSNGGQKGPQIDILVPGLYRINTNLFKVTKAPIVDIEGGKLGLIEAMDGEPVPNGRILAESVEGHNNFQKGEEFLKNGGQKGRQIQYLMPGQYRINTMLFELADTVDWVDINSDQVGIVTVKEGKPITDPEAIAAENINLDVHENFQNPVAFLQADGQKGLQIPVLRAGTYAINPWFASVKKVDMLEVEVGECAVMTSFVGDIGEDTTDSSVNARIVENGKRGIWKDPLGPGKHPVNTEVYRADKVSITQILLSWANDESDAHALDKELKTIVLRTKDGFNVSMDVRVIIHISMPNAPQVISNLGSVDNLISEVLEPAISAHFRNAAQEINALELLDQRRELQESARDHIAEVLKKHHVESVDTLIADIVVPTELAKTLQDRQLAVQNQLTYGQEQKAEETRISLEKSRAEADKEKDVVESQRNIIISQNKAKATEEDAKGKAAAIKIDAGAEAEKTKLLSSAEAEATKVTAAADAEKITKTGKAEAEVILEKGNAQATAYQKSVEAMGGDYARMEIIKFLSKGDLKLIPENIIVGGEGGSNTVDQFLGIAMLEKMTGRKFSEFAELESKEAKEES